MRKIIIVLLALLCLSSCKEKEIEKGEKQLSLYVSSDIHLLSDELLSDNSKYSKNELTLDGRVQEYDIDLLKKTVQIINEEKPDVFVITGDLTFNGELKSHLKIKEILDEVKDTKVLVIPGNHDIYNQLSYDYSDSKSKKTANISEIDFKDIYADYGYSDGISYDNNTLSYFYEIDESHWALMIDTSLWTLNNYFGENFVGGELLEETLNWISDNLKIAKEKNIEVISFSHHNLLVHNPRYEKNYTLHNNEALLKILNEYGVKLNLSGHLHIQSIKNEGDFYEIVNESILDYGNHIGILNVYEKAYEYLTKDIIIDDIDNFKEYSFNVFHDKLFYKRDKQDEISDIIAKINCYYFDGDYEMIHKVYEENKNLLEGVDEEYFKEMISVDNIDQRYLLIKK